MEGLFSLPSMLWWGAAASIPILIHLFARQRYKRVPWAAMELLRRAHRRTRRRLRIEHLLLLLLRILALLLLVGALADPRLDTGPLNLGDDGPRNVVVVIDDSFSMGLRLQNGSTPFDEARTAARDLVNGLRVDRRDRVTLLTCGEPAQLRLEASEDLDRAAQEIQQLEVSGGATDLIGALRTIEALLDDLPPAPDVYVFTDLQRLAFDPTASEAAPLPGAEEAASGGEELIGSLLRSIRSRDGSITIVTGSEAPTENLAVTEVIQRGRSAVTGVPVTFSATVRNFGEKKASGTVSWHVDGSTSPISQQVLDDVPPGSTRIVDLRHRFSEPGAHSVEARFSSDALEVDNRRGVVIEVRERIRVLMVDGSLSSPPEERASFFLSNALAPSDEEGVPGYFELEIIDETGLERARLSGLDLVALLDVSLISPQTAEDLEDFVRRGGGLLVAVGEKTRSTTLNDLLYRQGQGVLPARLGAVQGEDRNAESSYRLSLLVEDRPPLAYFSDPRIRPYLLLPPFYRYMEAIPPADDPLVKVLAAFDRPEDPLPSAMPAIVERRFGSGKSILFASSLDQSWTDLPAFYISYVPLANEIAHHLVRRENRDENLLVASSYETRLEGLPRQATLIRDGRQLELLTLLPGEEEGSFELRIDGTSLRQPGLYTIAFEGRGQEAPPDRYLVVNVDPRESDLQRVDALFLEQRFEDAGLTVTGDLEEAAAGNEDRRREDLWWWLLLLAGGVLLIETALAQHFAARTDRRRAAPSPGA